MEALLLIEAARRTLAQCADVAELLTEVQQAQALAGAVGSHLVLSGPPEVRTEALALSESGKRASGVYSRAGPRSLSIRADCLTGVRDPCRALNELAALLGQAGVALVSMSVRSAEAGLYWQCIEAIDAADESGDRVAGILRRFPLRERDGVV